MIKRKMRAILTVLMAVTSVCVVQAQRSHGDVLIHNVTVVSPERAAPLEHADVKIRNGRITQVGVRLAADPLARRIDGTGRFLIPGLIDSHVHVGHSAALDDDAVAAHPELWSAYRVQVPRAYLVFGFTSVVDLDLSSADKSWFEAAPLHPRLYSCGRGIKVAGGYMAFDVPASGSPNFPNLVFEPEEAKFWPQSLDPDYYTPERAVSRAADSGAICIKAFVEPGFGIFHWPYLHTATLQKIRIATEKRNMILIVHANAVDTWRSAVEAQAGVIAHGLWIWPGDQANASPSPAVRDVIAAAARSGALVQPTLQTVAGERSIVEAGLLDDRRLTMGLPKGVIAYLRSAEAVKTRAGLLEQYRKASPDPGFEPLLKVAIERTRATFKLMLQDRVPLILGSDTPGVDGFGNPPGLNGRIELQNWAETGAPLPLILRAATLDNAMALGLSHELGSIEAGKRADLLLLKTNPLTSISAYDTIETIVLDGQVIPRESLRPWD